MVRRGYSTDPNYPKSVMAIVNKYNLTKYDKGSSMKTYPVIDKRSNAGVPTSRTNTHEFIAIHYLGVDGQNYNLYNGGYGGHATIYWDGTIYLRCFDTAVIWAVGASSGWKQKHPTARNSNTYSIEMCCHNDGDAGGEAKDWYFTQETQEAAVQLVRQKFKDFGWSLTRASVDKHLLRHFDITTKPCPNSYVISIGYKTNWTWEQFKEAVVTGVCPNSGTMTLPATDRALSKTDVKTLQEQLISIGISVGKSGADGAFGQNTYNAVKTFQKLYNPVFHLAVDGEYGAQTKEALTAVSRIRMSADVFSLAYYKAHNADVVKAYGTDNVRIIEHYFQYGMKEGRAGSATFNCKTYKNRYKDLQKAFGDAYWRYAIHYLDYGKKEGRKAI